MNLKSLLRVSCLTATILVGNIPNAFALPFAITVKDGTTLPTIVPVGSTVNAYYTVTNLSTRTRANNYVKYLPSNVTQVTGGSNCPATFTLAPNASCTLQLSISSMTNGRSANPRKHLMICYPGGKTCAGPSNADSLYVGTDQFLYVTNSSGNQKISVCNIDSTKNLVGMCRLTSSSFNSARGIVLNPSHTKAYITEPSDIQMCDVDLNSGDLKNCSTASSGFGNLTSIGINASGTTLYAGEDLYSNLYSCQIDSTTGAAPSCQNLNIDNFYSIGVATNYVYAGSVTYTGYIYKCAMLSDGSLDPSDCNYNTSPTFQYTPVGIAIDSAQTSAYIDEGSGVDKCTIDNNGDLTNCNTLLDFGSRVLGNFLSADNNHLFVVLPDKQAVYHCTGTNFANCTQVNYTFNSPYGIYTTN